MLHHLGVGIALCMAISADVVAAINHHDFCRALLRQLPCENGPGKTSADN
jgi:hypothetical protein